MNRRDFLRASSIAVGSVVISTRLHGGLVAEASSARREPSSDAGRHTVAFQHGVASGDPLQDRVIIWTRLTPLNASTADVSVGWEVATDPGFTELLHKGSTLTGPARDFTVKVDVLELEPGTLYYYRFDSQGLLSPRGVTSTLPQGDIKQVRFAVLSCANFPAGYFHVYAEAARDKQLDAVIHLGDYIYEYGSGGYATADAEALGRALPPDNEGETLTLSDYRKRYALYRTDQDLQTLHAAAPFIAVWDDHEISNDTWRHGAQNHTDGEGDFQARKDAALQAWFEWIPVRPASPADRLTIYRRFDFGKLVSLHMLDTRVVGRDRQLAFRDYYDKAGFKAGAFRQDSMDSNRSLLGPQQRDWLYSALERSGSTWQVLGQQVLMGRRMLPRALLSAFQDADATPDEVAATLRKLLNIKQRLQRSDDTLTGQELELVQTLVPFSLDAWDGYAYERQALLAHAVNQDVNLVVLAGDTHNAWASNLVTEDGRRAGVEFATSSVTSPGMESYLNIPLELVPMAEQAITSLAEDIQYVNIFQRGYMVVTFTPERATAEWHFVNSVKQGDYQMDQARRVALATGTGANNRRLFPAS